MPPKCVVANTSKSRFIVADPAVALDFGHSGIIILSDIGFWNEHFDQLQTWCRDNGAEQQGMTVNVPNEQVMTLFCLTWA
jgi:hypothetical protein